VSDIQNDAAVVGKRKNILKDDENKGLQVTASLRDQQLEKLASKLEDMDIGEKVAKMWDTAAADQAERLARQSQYLDELDEFIKPIYDTPQDWQSNIHLPTILTVCKTYHGRMFGALWDIDPPFVCRSRKPANEDQAMLVEELMRYTLRDWANDYEGVEAELDVWLWDWITKGDAYLKAGWKKEFSRFQNIEDYQVEDTRMEMDPASGDSVVVPFMRTAEREVTKTEEVFNGPNVKRIFMENIQVIGGEGNPQKADAVLEQSWITASEMWAAVDQKLFRKDSVEKAIQGGKDRVIANDATGSIKQKQIEQAGRSMLDREVEIDRYRVIEAYLKVDVDGSGITADVVVWVHARTREILRATYLRRTMPSGKRPYAHIAFHKRQGVEYSVGLVEMLYSLGKEIDAMHNINIDIGLMTSAPVGFYRPTMSTMKDGAIPLEPGSMIPVDEPRNDVYFPEMGNRTAFGFQEISALMNQVERVTSISELSLGIIGGQGVARTATGTRAVLGESSNNLSIYIKRMNRGWRTVLRLVFELLQQKLPPGFQFRITGDDGNGYWATIQDKQEICGMYDFELEANSSNSNKQIQQEQANMILQLTSNPMDLQLGIVSIANRYEALKNMLKVNGIKAVSKYTTLPQGAALQLTPLEFVDRILAGMDVPLNPTMDLASIAALMEAFFTDEELNGQFGPNELAVLNVKMNEIQQFQAAMQQQAATAAVASQQNMNTQASMQPGNMQGVAVNQEPQQGEGG
jgi:hypothetical protein